MTGDALGRIPDRQYPLDRHPHNGEDPHKGEDPHVSDASLDRHGVGKIQIDLRVRASDLLECMDDPSCDPERLRRTLKRFRTVNRLVSGWGGIYRSIIGPALADTTRTVRVLDIGCGGGDVLRRIVALSRRDGFRVEGLGIDPDPHAIEVAEHAEHVSGVHYRRQLSSALVTEGEQFDVVISNHLLHHLDSAALQTVLADSERLSERICLHADIERSPIAYAAFSLLGIPFAAGSFIRVDGLRSIRRSYRRAELAALLPAGWSAETANPFRLLAVHRADQK